MSLPEALITSFALFFVLSFLVVHIGGVFHPRDQNMTTVLIMTCAIPVVLVVVLGVGGLILG